MANQRPRRRSRTFGCAAIGVIGAAVLLYFLFKTLLLVPPQAIPPPQAPTRTALTHAERSAQQWRAAIQAAEAPSRPAPAPHAKMGRMEGGPRHDVVVAPRTIVMQEDDINTLIGASLASHPNDLIRSPRLRIIPSAVIVSGFVPWQGAYAPIEINALPVIRGGRVVLAVQTAAIAGLPAPPFVTELCQKRVDALVERKLGRLTHVSEIRLADGKMEVVL